MGLFTNQKKDRYGLTVEVGSGSVLLAIVHSNIDQPRPTIVWSVREHNKLRQIKSLEECSKSVVTALVNASLKFDGDGRKALAKYNQNAQISTIQFTVSAPWSYTVTKTINYNLDKAFKINDELIAELTKTILEKVDHEINTNELLKDNNLKLVAKHDMGMLANGYHVNKPTNNWAKSFCVSQSYALVQKTFVDAAIELRDKLQTKASIKIDSSILVQFVVTRELIPNQYNFSLVNVSYEATEIGIVRDGVLTYSTHIPFGSFSIAREIALATNVPLPEAFGWLHSENPFSFINNLSKTEAKEVEQIFENYTEKISELFRETGDSLSIPKTISLRTEEGTDALFSDVVTKACKRVLRSDPFLTLIKHELNKEISNSDFSLNMLAQFFHIKRNHPEIQNY
jgi:hypothetical protein